VDLLEDLAAEVYGGRDVIDVLYRDDPIRVRRHERGYILSMRLPFVSRDDMDIHRRGEELLIRVGSYKRNLILPATLQRLEVRGANFVGDRLEIAFGHDEDDERAAPTGGRRRGRKRG
jgi:arsenite-transporting ATPase